MKKNSPVKVYRAGYPEQQQDARVIVASANLNSLALAFGAADIKFPLSGMSYHREHGLVLCLLRDEKSHPYWCDLFTGDKFGIVTGAES
jgi:hypothetical protein